MRKTLTILILVSLLFISQGCDQGNKPADLVYQDLQYDPPDPANFRTELANGLRGYFQEDHRLPLFNISASINFGSQ